MFEKEMEFLKSKKRGQQGPASIVGILLAGGSAMLVIVVLVLLFNVLGGSTVTNAVTMQNASALPNVTQAASSGISGLTGLVLLVITLLVLVVVVAALFLMVRGGLGSGE